MRPPFPNTPPPNMNQQIVNNINNNFVPPPMEPAVALMDTPNIRGQGNPRFQGFNNGRGGGEAGFNANVGPVPRPRWNVPPNQVSF